MIATWSLLSCLCAASSACYDAHEQEANARPHSHHDAGSSGATKHDAGKPTPEHDAGHAHDAGTGLDATTDANFDATVPADASADANGGGLPDAGSLARDAGDPGDLVPAPGLRVAFLGDQSLQSSAVEVLQLVASEHADMVIHAGDFDYVGDPAGWDAQIDSVLGSSFPYFSAIGNHDAPFFTGPDGYQARMQARVDRISGASCTGDLGVNSACSYRGLYFVLSGVGTYGSDHEAYLDSALDNPALWRLCIWHKNQHDMQVVDKLDEVGWDAYQICQRKGAPIITAHSHSYSRTYTLTALGDHDNDHGFIGRPDLLTIAPGSSAVFVTALGGMTIRGYNGALDPWWATIYTGNFQVENATIVDTAPSIDFGALFIDFNVDNDPHKARGYFKTTKGQLVDHFEMVIPK